MSTSSQSRKDGQARVELRNVICMATVNDEVAEEKVDAFEAETLNAALAVARHEYLTDNTGTPEDEAYNQGITDVIAAITYLRDGGVR